MPGIKKRADGRYVKTVTDPRTGKRIYFYGASEREINKKMLIYQQKQNDGYSFSEVAGEWWEEAEPKLAVSSVGGYKKAKETAVDEFGDDQIKSISTRAINSYLAKIARKGYSQKTVAKHKLVVNLILQFAVREGYIEYNPCTSASMPKHLPKERRQAASPEDETRVKKSADVWLFPFFALMTGMRKGEILALQWRDIDFDSNLISVTKSVYHDGNTPHIKPPKTEESCRVVPLLAPLCAELLKQNKRSPDRYIFSDDKDGSTPLTKRRYETLYRNFQKDTGVTCTAHQLRHSFATIGFEANLDGKTMQEILGHRQLSTTMDIYTDFRKKKMTAAAAALNSSEFFDVVIE